MSHLLSLRHDRASTRVIPEKTLGFAVDIPHLSVDFDVPLCQHFGALHQ